RANRLVSPAKRSGEAANVRWNQSAETTEGPCGSAGTPTWGEPISIALSAGFQRSARFSDPTERWDLVTPSQSESRPSPARLSVSSPKPGLALLQCLACASGPAGPLFWPFPGATASRFSCLPSPDETGVFGGVLRVNTPPSSAEAVGMIKAVSAGKKLRAVSAASAPSCDG